MEEGWDTEDIEISDEDLLSKETSNAKTLLDEAKAGNVDELQPPCKVTLPHNLLLRVLPVFTTAKSSDPTTTYLLFVSIPFHSGERRGT